MNHVCTLSPTCRFTYNTEGLGGFLDEIRGIILILEETYSEYVDEKNWSFGV